MFQPRTGTSPELGPVSIVNLISSLSPPTCFDHFLYLHFPRRTYSYPPPPHLSPLGAVPLSLLHPILPPKFPSRGDFVHMDVAPTCWPPPLVPTLTSIAVLDLLRRSLPAPRVPYHVPMNAVSLVRSPPFFRPWPALTSLSDPRVFHFRGYLPLSAFLYCPPVHSPPTGLNRRPSPLPVLWDLCIFYHTPVPCASASSSLL